MIGIALCFAALAATYWAGRRSLGQGLVALLTFGYFYGILRANILSTFSHFIFDAGLVGLYLSQRWFSSDPREAKRLEVLRVWTAILIIWPALVALLPFQPLLVSLVGLRGNVFFLPVLLLGARLRHKDLLELSCGLAGLNLVAAGFAAAEYFTSVMNYYPYSPVTMIIYASADAGGGYFRIPAIFVNAHAYGGAMVASLPYLMGGWEHFKTRLPRILAVSGIAAALIGVLMSATRQNFIVGLVMVLAALLTHRAKVGKRLVFVILILIVGWAAASNERFQRFKTLSDTDYVGDRIAGSVNRGFWEILAEHPMGNGLGGGGSSIPYFLFGEVRNPIGMENEYARILCEQGIVGFLLWIGFVVWFLSRAPAAFSKGPWAASRRMAWSLAVFSVMTMWIGVGFLTAIPSTMVVLMGMGWAALPRMPESPSGKDKTPARLRREPIYAPVPA